VNTILTIPARTFISSHETGIIEGDISEMARRYLAVIDRREDMLLSFLALPRTFDEIAGQWLIYKKPREPLEFYTFVERAHIWKHLDRLLHNGTVQYDNRLFYRC
jgi:hypothetical protein